MRGLAQIIKLEKVRRSGKLLLTSLDPLQIIQGTNDQAQSGTVVGNNADHANKKSQRGCGIKARSDP